MELQSFIQSGLLEAYVLGQCTPEERALVERMVAGHAEARTELAAIEKALEGYAAANAAEPPAWMKERILEVIENEAGPPKSPEPQATPSPVSGPVVSRLSLLFILGFALLSGFLFFQKSNLASEKTTLENRLADLQRQIDDCVQNSHQKDTLQQVVQLLLDRSDTHPVQLSPLTGGGNAAGVYHNATRCQIAIDLATLPALEKGKYYQFWAIEEGSTTPVPIGNGWGQSGSGWQILPCHKNAVTLAISLEDKRDGNLAPSGVFRAGNIPVAGG